MLLYIFNVDDKFVMYDRLCLIGVKFIGEVVGMVGWLLFDFIIFIV